MKIGEAPRLIGDYEAEYESLMASVDGKWRSYCHSETELFKEDFRYNELVQALFLQCEIIFPDKTELSFDGGTIQAILNVLSDKYPEIGQTESLDGYDELSIATYRYDGREPRNIAVSFYGEAHPERLRTGRLVTIQIESDPDATRNPGAITYVHIEAANGQGFDMRACKAINTTYRRRLVEEMWDLTDRGIGSDRVQQIQEELDMLYDSESEINQLHASVGTHEISNIELQEILQMLRSDVLKLEFNK